MSKSNEKFFDGIKNEINEMIEKQQYNEEAFNKLLVIVATSQILAEREHKEDVKKTLIKISIVGEFLARKLYKLKGGNTK